MAHSRKPLSSLNRRGRAAEVCVTVVLDDVLLTDVLEVLELEVLVLEVVELVVEVLEVEVPWLLGTIRQNPCNVRPPKKAYILS